MTEHELIDQAKQGDAAALDALYRRHASRVYTVVRRLTGDDAQAEDAAQETWMRAMRALPSFRGQAMFSTWLHRIAVNCALYGRRRRERNKLRELELPGNAGNRIGGGDQVGQRLLRLDVVTRRVRFVALVIDAQRRPACARPGRVRQAWPSKHHHGRRPT